MRSARPHVRTMVILAGLIGAFVSSTAAQDERATDLWIGASTGYINLGQFVREPVRHVRFGNTGKDLYFAVDVESRRRGSPLGVTARLLLAPTHDFVWPRSDGEEVSRWHWRPDARRAMATPVIWSCLTVGAQWHPRAWVSGGVGGGFCSLSGGNYFFGALPMHTPVLNVAGAQCERPGQPGGDTTDAARRGMRKPSRLPHGRPLFGAARAGG